jgi:hypothetical protein
MAKVYGTVELVQFRRRQIVNSELRKFGQLGLRFRGN